jgi:hypothetical protein
VCAVLHSMLYLNSKAPFLVANVPSCLHCQTSGIHFNLASELNLRSLIGGCAQLTLNSIFSCRIRESTLRRLHRTSNDDHVSISETIPVR